MAGIENIIKNVEKFDITKGQYDELLDNLRRIKFQLQEINDTLNGRIRSANIVEYRNTMIFNDWGILDSTHPFIMDFELVDEMTKLVECKVTFKIRNYRVGTTLP